MIGAVTPSLWSSQLRVGDIIEFEDRAGITRRGHVARISARSVTVHCARRKDRLEVKITVQPGV